MSEDADMTKAMGGPLGEHQQGVPLTGEALARFRAKQEARLGHPPKTGPTPAEKRRIEADIRAAKADAKAAAKAR